MVSQAVAVVGPTPVGNPPVPPAPSAGQSLWPAPRRIGALACILVGLSACGGGAYRPVTIPPSALGGDLPVSRPTVREANRLERPAVSKDPPDTLALQDALALALLENPGLRAFSWEARAREAQMLQSGRRPNPVLTVLAEDLYASGPGSTGQNAPVAVQPQTTVQLSQLIELGGKRLQRRNIAASALALAEWDFEAGRIDVVTNVVHAFVDVLTAQELVGTANRTAELVDSVMGTVSARVTAGVASPVEEIRAGMEVAGARVESHRAIQQLESARRELAALWGATEARFTVATGTLEIGPDLPPLSTLSTRVSANPDLARWATAIVQRQAELDFERARRVPDLELIAGYRRFQDLRIGAAVLGASIALPIFDRNGGGVQEAASRLAGAAEQQRAAEVRVASRLAEVYAMLSAAHQEVLALRSSVLPGAQRAFEAVSEGYRLGRFGYLDVLEAQRTLHAANSRYLRAVAEYHKAVADAERLIGGPLWESAVPPG